MSKILKYFYDLIKHFLLNSSSERTPFISNANCMQPVQLFVWIAIARGLRPGLRIWNIFELQLPIVHEVRPWAEDAATPLFEATAPFWQPTVQQEKQK